MYNRDEQPDLSSAVLAGLVALLVILAAVVWIAFCLALHRTAKRISEIKRQRRRQVDSLHSKLGKNGKLKSKMMKLPDKNDKSDVQRLLMKYR